MRRNRRGGNMAFETVLWLPVILLLLVGMVQFGKLTYTYYTIKKMLYAAGRSIAVQQGVDFCGDANGLIAAAKSMATTGTADGSADAYLANLTPDQIEITPECVDPNAQTVGTCSMICDSESASPRPDFLTVSLANGYQYTLRLPYILQDPIVLRPSVRVAFGGT